MLGEKTCIAICEKVWGMSLKDLAQLRFDEGGHAPPDGLEYIENYTKQLVNSWSGFGRTVEAMAEKGFDFSCEDGVVYFIKHGDQYESFYGVSPFKGFISATHLAALEALNEEGS